MLTKSLRFSGAPAVGSKRCVRGQTGLALIEAMVAVLIFAIGLLSALKLQADSTTRSTDALYRAEATMLAHEIIGTIWTDRANISSYAHNPSGGTECAPTASASANANVLRWLGEFTTAGNGRYLPGATSSNQQITVDASTPPIVTVKICWRGPLDTTDSNFVVVSQVPL